MEASAAGLTWEQQPGESGPAFAAFRALRDMGPVRSAVKAYEQSKGRGKGKSGARQTPGRWNAWAKGHRWAERARAFDAHFESIRLHNADEVAAGQGRSWAVRREEQAERVWQIAEELSSRVEMLLKLPVVDVTTEADGKTTVVKAIRVRDLKIVAAVATAASRLAWAAINAAEATYGPDPNFDPATATDEELRAFIARHDPAFLARHDAMRNRNRPTSLS